MRATRSALPAGTSPRHRARAQSENDACVRFGHSHAKPNGGVLGADIPRIARGCGSAGIVMRTAPSAPCRAADYGIIELRNIAGLIERAVKTAGKSVRTYVGQAADTAIPVCAVRVRTIGRGNRRRCVRAGRPKPIIIQVPAVLGRLVIRSFIPLIFTNCSCASSGSSETISSRNCSA